MSIANLYTWHRPIVLNIISVPKDQMAKLRQDIRLFQEYITRMENLLQSEQEYLFVQIALEEAEQMLNLIFGHDKYDTKKIYILRPGYWINISFRMQREIFSTSRSIKHEFPGGRRHINQRTGFNLYTAKQNKKIR